MSAGTGTMQRVGGGSAGSATPGLLLLCASEPERVPHVVPLRGEGIVIGREPPAGGCRIDQTAVSRVHARIMRSGEGWRIEDLGSRNGTYVDGQRIASEDLQGGETIRVGDALFELVPDEIEAHRSYAYVLSGPAAREARDLADADNSIPALVGGLKMRRVAAQIEVAAPTPLCVLVLGETGTGKEVVARAIHERSGRTGAYVTVNCAAIPTHLFESELFGFRKGAFTGATHDKAGLLQTAAEGTVLLDEIGDLALESQAKLLRVLESREVPRLGAVTPERVDVRFVCATNIDLEAQVQAGRFRADLLARIASFTLRLPPLRERRHDIGRLVSHFLRKGERADLGPSFPFMLGMCDYDWPHNVRECEAAVRRALLLAEGKTLESKDLPQEIQTRLESYGTRAPRATRQAGAASVLPPMAGAEPPRPSTSEGVMPTAEDLRRLLTMSGGNVTAVARELGKDRAQVHRLLRRHGLDADQFRPPGK